MLTYVEIRTMQGALLTLPMQDISDGIIIESIEGLDPVKANLVSSSFAQMDGEQFHTARREKRNIIFNLALEAQTASQTVSNLRNMLYNYFMPPTKVNMRFYSNDRPMVMIEGRIESFVAPLFTADPTSVISVVCFDPDFVDPVFETVNGNTTYTTLETAITYDGTVNTGVEFSLLLDRTLTDFTLFNRVGSDIFQTMEFTVATPLASGDVLKFTTQAGQKSIVLTSGGIDSSLLYGLSPQSGWITFEPGVNNFRAYTEGADIPYTIKYYNKYGGL